MAGNRADFARQLSPRVGSPAEFSAKVFTAINNAPEKQLAKLGSGRANRELQLYALELIGRKNAEQAARLIEDMSEQLSAADQRFAWQQLGLSAARRRWSITTLKGAINRDDPRAPGGFALAAELTRSRSERPGSWRLEQDDETYRLRLADRLAGDGLGERGRTGLAA